MFITLKNIRCNPVIGAYSEERNRRQPVLITITIEFDEGAAPQSDKLEDTLDYCALTRRIVKEVNATKFQLVEKLVVFVLDMVLEEPRAHVATVEIDKPEALQTLADSVSVKASKSKMAI